MAIRTELNLRLANSPGVLTGVCTLLSDERVNILALELDGSGRLRLVVDNPVHAAGVLREHHYQVGERDVLFVSVPNTAGALAPMLRLISDAGVNIDYAYGGSSDTSPTAVVVIGVEDAQRASAAAGV